MIATSRNVGDQLSLKRHLPYCCVSSPFPSRLTIAIIPVDTHSRGRQMTNPGQPDAATNPSTSNSPITIACSAPPTSVQRFLRRHPPHRQQTPIATHPDFADAVYRGRAVSRRRDRPRPVRARQGLQPPGHPHHALPGRGATVTNTVSYPPDTTACMFWLRNRQRQYWQARVEAPPEPETAPDIAGLLDAACGRMRHAGE